MSVDRARLAIDSRKREGRYGHVLPPPVCSRIFNEDPRLTGFALEELANGYVSTLPSIAGEICAYREAAGRPRVLLLMSIMDPGGSGQLTWLPVDMTNLLLDKRTGKPYDPNAQFYNPLAS